MESTESSNHVNETSGVEPTKTIACGFWRRLAALILDGLCLGALGLVLGLLLFDPLSHLGGWGRLVGFSITLVYFGVLNSDIGKGQTVGKRIMKIAVVNNDGNHISLARSCLRYFIIGIPYFLNGAIISPNMINSFIGVFVSFIVFGVGGAIIYLFVFNRKTRQSLHDLVVGSFVIKRVPKGQLLDTVWRPHLVVVAMWLVTVASLSVVMIGISKKGVFPELQAVQNAIQASGAVHTVSANVGTQWKISQGERTDITYFQSTAIWKEEPEDYEAAAQNVASLILQSSTSVADKDFLIVTITYGYDIGIARTWKAQHFQYSPSKWQEVLTAGESTATESVTTSS